MRSLIKIKRGYDLPLKGGVSPDAKPVAVKASSVALCPDDFPGFVAKPDVKPGQTVKAGEPLMHDKERPTLCLCSPVAGTVADVVRGARRKVERVVVIPAAGESIEVKYDKTASRQAKVDAMGRAGLLCRMRQLPFAVVPDPGTTPRDIFVTAFDTAPLAPALLTMAGTQAELQAGVDLLDSLTDGSVVICTREGSALPPLEHAETVDVRGPHPAGNVSVQVNHIAPVNKGETVWMLDIVTLGKIGRWTLSGKVDNATMVAVVGPEVVEPKLVATVEGADIKSVIAGDIKDAGKTLRVIAGNPLTGALESIDGYLRAPYRQVTLVEEGTDHDEFMGWASLSPNKMSRSRTFLSAFMPKRKLGADALLHGSPRAMIMSGIYDKMIPMDIMPEPLIKAMLGKDIEQMEALGALEVTPDDFALAEWADPSKLPLQKIVRQSLDYLKKEL